MKKFRKPYRVKRKKPILRRYFFRLGVLFFIFAVVLFYFLFFSEIFQVQKIIVTGEETVAKDSLKSLVEEKLENKILFFKTKSIFLIDVQDIRKDILDKFPQIIEVEISRGFFDALNIAVIERLALAVWCQDEGCFLLDNRGVIFEKAPPEIDLIKIIDKQYIGPFALGEKVIEEELLSRIFGIESKLMGNLKISITEVSIISNERLDAETSEDWKIFFNLQGDLDWQITELGLVLVKQIPLERRRGLEYIDLRFSRIYYK